MNRQQFEHVIREVGRRLKIDYFYIVGSAAVFGSIPDATDRDLIGTRDVDVIPSPPDPADAEKLADRLDFLLGEGSEFDAENGCYVQGVDLSTPAYAPKGGSSGQYHFGVVGIRPFAWRCMTWPYPSMVPEERKILPSHELWPERTE